MIDINPLASHSDPVTLRIVGTFQGMPGNVATIWLEGGRSQCEQSGFIWQDAIIYSLMIDRFRNGDPLNDRPVDDPRVAWQANFNGGDFAGISQTIRDGYFNRLGVNALWVSPVNQTTDSAFVEWPEPHRVFTGYHGYWPVSATQTEPRFGSLEEFQLLVKTAHSDHLAILLDFVSNHTHIAHPFYRQHPEWYGRVDLPDGSQNIRRWDEYRLTTWFDTFLPSFDYENSAAATEAMTDNAVWWLKTTGIDGFRHDATKHVPYQFWRSLTRKIARMERSDRSRSIFQIGETFGGNELIKSYVNNGMLNSQFNFGQFFAARRVFADPAGDFRDLEAELTKALEVYGDHHVMGNIMDSHDQVRMMAFLDGDLTLSDNGTERAWQQPPITVDQATSYDKALVFMTLLLTTPGIPIIYYGDEFGMTGANDPDNRRMMRFDDQLSPAETRQLERVSEIVQLRRRISALRRGDYRTLFTDRDIYLFCRGDLNGRVLIALNKGQTERSLTIELPDWLTIRSAIPLTGKSQCIVNNHQIHLNLGAFESAVWFVQ